MDITERFKKHQQDISLTMGEDPDILIAYKLGIVKGISEVKFCYQNSIMNGTSPTTIDPLLNTPREQAIVLINRTYNSFSAQ